MKQPFTEYLQEREAIALSHANDGPRLEDVVREFVKAGTQVLNSYGQENVLLAALVAAYESKGIPGLLRYMKEKKDHE